MKSKEGKKENEKSIEKEVEKRKGTGGGETRELDASYLKEKEKACLRGRNKRWKARNT